MLMGRNGQSGNYRYGFNGKEMDNDMRGGTGATYDYGFRIYDSRIAKFLSVDPLTKSYPWYTPYQFAGNMPIAAIDLDGAEVFMSIHGGRLTVPTPLLALGPTVGINIGIMGDFEGSGNIGLYIDPHLGIGIGMEIGVTTLGFGFNWQANSMDDLKGWDTSLGASIGTVNSFLTGEWDIAWPTKDNNGKYPDLPDQFKLLDPEGKILYKGGSYSPFGFGEAFGGHADIGYTSIKKFKNIPEAVDFIYKNVNRAFDKLHESGISSGNYLRVIGADINKPYRLEDYIPKEKLTEYLSNSHELAKKTGISIVFRINFIT
jgi:RHS repeat-associated protein